MNEEERSLDLALAECEQENRLLRARIDRLEKEALAQPEQKPVAWITQGGKGWLRWHKSYDDNKDSVPLYTTPPQRTWVGLTDEDMTECIVSICNTDDGTGNTRDLIRAVEAKLKEKNT